MAEAVEAEIDTKTRHISLDALRGFAVMGILTMNIIVFAMPEMAYINPAAVSPPDSNDIISWVASFILFDGKMRGLFSLLFGASMLLIVERAKAKGENPKAVHYRRMGWLALFGLAHFFFVWWGDILFLYAAIGCVAYLFKDMEARGLIKMAIIIYVIGILLLSLYTASLFLIELAGSGADADPEMAKAYKETMAEFTEGPQRDLAVYRSDYGAIIWSKLTEKWFAPLVGVLMNFCETLPLMMIGMALLKNGFLTGKLPASLYRKWIIAGLLLGGAGYAMLAWLSVSRDFDMIMMLNVTLSWSYPFRLLMTIGYAAALIMLIESFANSGFMHRVAAAGRVAFTNYLGTSIVMTSIFYGYGFGLYGYVPRAELGFYVLGMCAFMLIWSKPWLERFHYGPLEWLWRSLARWEKQPFRRV